MGQKLAVPKKKKTQQKQTKQKTKNKTHTVAWLAVDDLFLVRVEDHDYYTAAQRSVRAQVIGQTNLPEAVGLGTAVDYAVPKQCKPAKMFYTAVL